MLFHHKFRPVPGSINHFNQSAKFSRAHKPNVAKCRKYLLHQILTELNDQAVGVLPIYEICLNSSTTVDIRTTCKCQQLFFTLKKIAAGSDNRFTCPTGLIHVVKSIRKGQEYTDISELLSQTLKTPANFLSHGCVCLNQLFIDVILQQCARVNYSLQNKSIIVF